MFHTLCEWRRVASSQATDGKAPAGYKKDGTVGTVLAAEAHGTAPLWLYFNAALQDHLTCALPDTVAYAKANGYVLAQSAPLGYVYTAPEWAESHE